MEKQLKIPCEIYSRVSGYFRPISNFNIGKQQEFKDRKFYKIGSENYKQENENGKLTT